MSKFAASLPLLLAGLLYAITPSLAADFLSADQVFKLHAERPEIGVIILNWDIEPGYYLYKDKIQVEITAPDQTRIGQLILPQGQWHEDEFFGRSAIFVGAIQAQLLLEHIKADEPVTISVGYQGCADAGLCYPPIEEIIELKFSTNTGSMIDAASNRFMDLLKQGHALTVSLLFFGFGLMLSFTPCVLPMVPIVAAIVAGGKTAQSGWRGFRLSAAYVLAMALAYTLFGIIAALFGHNLQALLQNPWAISGFAAVFVVLALSSFGVYELQVPASWRNRLDDVGTSGPTGAVGGAALLGFISALIVGPCITAPLAGALLYIGQTGDVLIGATALFSLGMGMGVPLLAIGTAGGKWLPKSGPWMILVSRFFGFVLLGMAIWMLSRILPLFWISLLWAALLLMAGIALLLMGDIMRIFTREYAATPTRSAFTAAGAVLIIAAAVMLFSSLHHQQPTVSTQAQEIHAAFEKVHGSGELMSALQQSTSVGQWTMLDVYADWCISCKYIERDVLPNPEVSAYLLKMRLLRADITGYDAEDKALLRQFKIIGPPAMLFFGPGKDEPVYRIDGEVDVKEMLSHLKAMQAPPP